MEDREEAISPPTEINGESVSPGSRAEFVKIILDFISKCFYPAILVTVLIFLYPIFENIDFQNLIDRLQSAKAGQVEVTFSLAEDVGAETAPLNNKVAELERLIANLQGDVSRLQNRVDEAQVSTSEMKVREELARQFQENSKYTALVFHRRESREDSRKITDQLLKAGFKSSGTETDFTELRKIKPTPGVIFVTYNQAGEVKLSEIEKLLEDTIPEADIKINPRAIELRRGDVQVLVF